MKLVKTPDTVIGIAIKKKGVKSVHLTVHEATQDEVIQRIKHLVQKRLLEKEEAFFLKGDQTHVEVRIREKSVAGESRSFSFRGLDPDDVRSLIMQDIEEE